MNKLIYLAIISLFINTSANASEHHSGHVGMGGGNSAGHCIKAHIAKFNPAHLVATKPQSEFSFVAFNVYKPDLITVTVKNQPVDVDIEFKDPFYIVKGKIPEGLTNTVARVNVKIAGKAGACDSENGWLLKIE